MRISLKSDRYKVKAYYSTPSCYVAAVKRATSVDNFQQKTDDFFPYESSPHAYWTGYFTSRPTLKGIVRQSSAFMQVILICIHRNWSKFVKEKFELEWSMLFRWWNRCTYTPVSIMMSNINDWKFWVKNIHLLFRNNFFFLLILKHFLTTKVTFTNDVNCICVCRTSDGDESTSRCNYVSVDDEFVISLCHFFLLLNA